ncbi:protein phosphatase 1 regulatory subunit 1B isoform X2 [Austrofundulus limnaeus]|uniref:Protein phosphatase 1 regulatory subunit 1B n=1 Tax=Austrofundulus limnaeus TaxID=52670 RepID=A0A2I4CE69_AUSLI|nr:PREDICTED: protein phosphatase 1 regulatory subunit 1B isoform X2 [Austrofundulus limnaeus]
MEPSVSTHEGEHKERKKIQFAVPASAPTQLDPRQVEMIRRRRPTPATLFRVADQPSPEDDQSSHQVKWVVGENGMLKPKRVNPSVYQPPSLKEDPCEGEEDEDDWQEEEGEEGSPVEAADRSETPATGHFSTAKEEDEKEEDKIEENSLGSN